jgi:hypothetical protein
VALFHFIVVVFLLIEILCQLIRSIYSGWREKQSQISHIHSVRKTLKWSSNVHNLLHPFVHTLRIYITFLLFLNWNKQSIKKISSRRNYLMIKWNFPSKTSRWHFLENYKFIKTIINFVCLFFLFRSFGLRFSKIINHKNVTWLCDFLDLKFFTFSFQVYALEFQLFLWVTWCPLLLSYDQQTEWNFARTISHNWM